MRKHAYKRLSAIYRLAILEASRRVQKWAEEYIGKWEISRDQCDECKIDGMEGTLVTKNGKKYRFICKFCGKYWYRFTLENIKRDRK